jgi:glycosyltransferase involved in cell wall biosynthesis
MVGRLVSNKGFDQVLQAVAKLGQRGLDKIRVRLVGKGPQAAKLLAFARENGFADRLEHIEWVPDADALAATYRSARLLVCASTSEGGPRVVAEAMACGTPVISTGIGIVPELIRDGVNGRIYDGTTEHLALTLQRLLTDAVQQQTLRGNLPADLSTYDRDTVITRLADGLKSIATNAKR